MPAKSQPRLGGTPARSSSRACCEYDCCMTGQVNRPAGVFQLTCGWPALVAKPAATGRRAGDPVPGGSRLSIMRL